MRVECGESPRNLHTQTHLKRVRPHTLRWVYQLYWSSRCNDQTITPHFKHAQYSTSHWTADGTSYGVWPWNIWYTWWVNLPNRYSRRAESLRHMCRHGPVIAQCTDSVAIPHDVCTWSFREWIDFQSFTPPDTSFVSKQVCKQDAARLPYRTVTK